MSMFKNMTYEEIDDMVNQIVNSPNFDQLTQDFFGSLIEHDMGKEERKNFENSLNLDRNAEIFCYWN